MNGTSSDLPAQSQISFFQTDLSTSPTLTLIALPLGFRPVHSSTNLGLSASLPIAVMVLLLDTSSLGILGTAHEVSVHEDQGPLSSSRKGASEERPLPGEMSSTNRGPKLVRTSVSSPTVIPMTETPCDPPKRSLESSGNDQTVSQPLDSTRSFLRGRLLFSLSTELGTISLTPVSYTHLRAHETDS